MSIKSTAILKNIAFCKSKNIRISVTPLGHPKNNPPPEEHKTTHQDNMDHIEVEKGFGLANRCFVNGLNSRNESQQHCKGAFVFICLSCL